jgi:hypothetical protein
VQSLQSLAVTFITGQVAAAQLAPLEGLPCLRSLTLSACPRAEEGGQRCLAAFPDTLLRLRGLTALSLSSKGITALPTGLTRLKHLASLDASGCYLHVLPSNLWRLAWLRRLRLNSTNLLVAFGQTWETLGKLPRLEALELR